MTKSKQQAHPKKSTRKTTRPMQLVYTDLMGPFTPAAKGGSRFVSKFTDDYSRMKEIFLLKNKTEAAESLHQYNMTVAAPLGLRIENLRCDKGGEYTGQELEGQVQRLRQEVNRLSKINTAQSPSPSSTPASPGVAVDQRDAGTREPEPASPSITQEPENEDEHGPPLPAAPVTGPSLKIEATYDRLKSLEPAQDAVRAARILNILAHCTHCSPPTTTTREPSPPVNFSTLPHRRRHQC